MEENKKCIYCNEIMTCGPHKQIMYMNINKSVSFIQYGWKCQMKTDNCDIVFDNKDIEINKINTDKAIEDLNN